jgi:hypothetical protein
MVELSKQISTQMNERIRYGLNERIRIDICCYDEQHIWLCISKNNNIETIIELCNPFVEFITNIKKEFDLNCSLEVSYDNDNNIKRILVMSDNNHITVENLLEGYTFIKKIYELQIKYCTKTYFYMTCNRFVIENIDTEYIDLLDFIPNHQKKTIVNGYITNNYNSKFMQSKNIHFSPPSTIIIKIKNCPNLKIINNIIIFKKNSKLKIKNCPKLEFIESYNHFSKIYIDSRRIKYTSTDKPPMEF